MRYYFDVHNGTQARDERGQILGSRREAELAAIRILSEAMTRRLEDHLPAGRLAVYGRSETELLFSIVAISANHG